MTEGSSIKELLRENISSLGFLPSHYIFYDINFSHKQKHEFVCRLAGKFRNASSVRGSTLAVIRVTAVKSSRVFDKGKFEKNGL